jgi:hypothetical protein
MGTEKLAPFTGARATAEKPPRPRRAHPERSTGNARARGFRTVVAEGSVSGGWEVSRMWAREYQNWTVAGCNGYLKGKPSCFDS